MHTLNNSPQIREYPSDSHRKQVGLSDGTSRSSSSYYDPTPELDDDPDFKDAVGGIKADVR